MTEGTPGEIVDIDNCRAMGLTLGTGKTPVVVYQGGQIRECGAEQQSDVMMNIGSANTWTEVTAGIGYVERNPVFQDGLAGQRVTAAADSNGNIHVAYQFFYEGCDAMNFNYPDLLYVQKQGSNPEAEAAEETVEGNIYNANGTASAQNNVGEHARLILDQDQDPVIFYYADLSPNNSDPDQKGLRVARKKGESWEHEWVETGIQVEAISAALDQNGNLFVTGIFNQVIEISDFTLVANPPNLYFYNFLIQVNPKGRVLMAETIYGKTYYDDYTERKVRYCGDYLYYSGSFEYTGVIGNEQFTSYGFIDNFISKIDLLYVTIPEPATLASDPINIYCHSGRIFISNLSEEKNYKIEVLNLTGQVVYQSEVRGTQESSFSMNQVDGIYLVSVKNAEDMFVRKILFKK